MVLGGPYHWRTGGGDMSKDFTYEDLFHADAVQPWSVGRFSKVTDDITEDYQADLELCQKHNKGY